MVIVPKDKGGLGVKNLKLQNEATAETSVQILQQGRGTLGSTYLVFLLSE